LGVSQAAIFGVLCPEFDRMTNPVQLPREVSASIRLRDFDEAFLFFFAGLLLNYFVERSALGIWPGFLLSIVAFWMTLTGLSIGVVQLIHFIRSRSAVEVTLFPPNENSTKSVHTSPSPRPFLVMGLVIPIAVLYGLFYVGIEFVDSGVGAFADCHGLRAAAASSGDIPESLSTPDNPAVSCQTGLFGMFLTRYDILNIYGVTTSVAQTRVLGNLQNFRRASNTKPLRVEFYEKENWTSWRNEKSGASGGKRGPEKLIREVVIR
jgi:hypothetical protein